MSFSAKKKGVVPDVQKSVHDDATIPGPIQRAVGHLLQAYAPDQLVEVETSGSLDKETRKGEAVVKVRSVETGDLSEAELAQARQRENMTPAEREAEDKRRAGLTQAQRDAEDKRLLGTRGRHRDNMTQAERDAEDNRRAALTQEQRDAEDKRLSGSRGRHRDNMTQAERDAEDRRRAGLTQAQRDAEDADLEPVV